MTVKIHEIYQHRLTSKPIVNLKKANFQRRGTCNFLKMYKTLLYFLWKQYTQNFKLAVTSGEISH